MSPFLFMRQLCGQRAQQLAPTADWPLSGLQLDTALVRNITAEFPAGEAAVLALASMPLPYQPALGREALEGAAKRLSIMAQEGDQRLQRASQRVGHALVSATQGEALVPCECLICLWWP